MFCILVAHLSNKALINLAEPVERKALLALRSTEIFYCPSCHSQLVLKLGEIKIPHFAHKSLSACDNFSEPESALHLQGKILLHQFFKDQNFSIELEKYLPEIRQRADLLVNGQTAIEFQCSSISANQIIRRSKGYHQIGIHPLWLGGIKTSIKEQIQVIRLKNYEHELLQQKHRNPFLLSFRPEDNRFYYYSNLFYISGSRRIGKVKSLPAEKQSYPFAIPKQLTKVEFRLVCLLFSQARQKFIHNQFFAKNRMRNPFWRACYKLRLDIKKLPETIGIPFLKAACIPQHAVLWQLQAIAAFEQGESMSSLIHSGEIPLANPSVFAEAEQLLEEYLEIYLRLKGQEENFTSLMDLLYDNYCNNV